jgi:hypothetical protein
MLPFNDGFGERPEEFDFPDHLMPGPILTPDVSMLGTLATPVDPYGSGFAGPISVDLILRLEGLSPSARAEKIEELKSLDGQALSRENNAAWNYFMMSGLGLGNAEKETLWGGAEILAPPKRKAAKGKGGCKAKKARRDPESEAEPSAGSESESESTKEMPAPRTTAAARPAAGKAKGKRGQGAVGSKEPQAWATSAKAFLSNKSYGTEWEGLLGLWWEREEAAGFTGTVSSRCRHLNGS